MAVIRAPSYYTLLGSWPSSEFFHIIHSQGHDHHQISSILYTLRVMAIIRVSSYYTFSGSWPSSEFLHIIHSQGHGHLHIIFLLNLKFKLRVIFPLNNLLHTPGHDIAPWAGSLNCQWAKIVGSLDCLQYYPYMVRQQSQVRRAPGPTAWFACVWHYMYSNCPCLCVRPTLKGSSWSGDQSSGNQLTKYMIFKQYWLWFST